MNKNNLNIRPALAPLLFLLACCLVAFWPLTSGAFCLKNDATLYFLPVRFQVSEMIRSGHFPFWTPYLNLGYPLYSDMQAGVWNPFVLFISLFGSYTMRSLQVELLVYIYISGVSMFYLLKYFKTEEKIAALMAVSYMLCGFNLDSSQFAYWICGTAFLPAIFLFYHKMLHQQKWKDALLLSVFLYLLFVCGYPGECILIAYFLLAYLIVFLLKEKPGKPGRLIKLSATSALSFLLLSLPAIISYASSLPYVVRGGKIGYELAMTNTMHPVNLVSYFLPLTVWKLQPQITDLLGRNSYFGLFPFLLLIAAFFTKGSYLMGFLKWTFVVSLLFCLGDYAVIRGVFYNTLPLMNTFRHPSIARFLCIFCGSVLTAIYLDQLQNKINEKRRKVFPFIIVAFLFLATPVIFKACGFPLELGALKSSVPFPGIKTWLDKSSLMDWFLIDLIIQVFFLCVIYYYFVVRPDRKALLIISSVNVVIHAALLQPVTVVKNETVSSFQKKIDSYTRKGFPAPRLSASVFSNSVPFDSNSQRAYGPANMFNKEIGETFIFVSPSPLKSHERFSSREYDSLRNILFSYPILYKADTIISSAKDFITTPAKKILIEDPDVYKKYHGFPNPGGYTANFISFSPGHWKFEINSENPGVFCLVQQHYPNWKLYVNGKSEDLFICNASLMGFNVNRGNNIIEIKFSHPIVTVSLYISIGTLFLILFFILRKPKGRTL